MAAVGLVNAPPLSGLDANGGFMLDGQVWDDVKDHWVAQSAVYRIASDGYFRGDGHGADARPAFDTRDVSGAEPAAIVNESLARKHFAGRDPLGQRIRFAGMDEVNPWLTVVGVVRDVRFRDLGAEPAPEVFVDFRQLPCRTLYFMTTAVRLRPGRAPRRWRRAARGVAGSGSVDSDRGLADDALVERSTASRRFTLAVVGAFGIMALVLSGPRRLRRAQLRPSRSGRARSASGWRSAPPEPR